MSQPVIDELLSLSRRLLDSIDQQDWPTYSDLCDPSLTAFEPEAVGHLVGGMNFHRFYFQRESTGRAQQSTMSSPEVRLLGETAVVTYVRLVQRAGASTGCTTTAYEESRIWHRRDGRWQNVHFHRSRLRDIEL